MSRIKHGGNLHEVETNYSFPKDQIVDFSGNVNPFGPPKKAFEAIEESINDISKYPDVNYKLLKESISHYVEVSDENILVGNGASEIIKSLLYVIRKNSPDKKIATVFPTYEEYEREIKNLEIDHKPINIFEGDDFKYNIDLLIRELTEDVSAIVLCNPNNPTGSALKTLAIEIILTHCKMLDIFVIIDETYAEFTLREDISAIKLTNKYDNLFIIRGTSKFFAIPGLRLGYGIVNNKDIIEKMNAIITPWSINCFACSVSYKIFNDKDFISFSKKMINSQKEDIIRRLSKLEAFKIFESHCNFILLKILPHINLTSTQIYEQLLQKGYLIRDCNGYSILDDSYIRICANRPFDNQMLVFYLREILARRGE